jgi:hypothetical protein
MAIITEKCSLQEVIDWWIDGLVRLDIPMMENKETKDGREVLTEACEHAKALGARLFNTPRLDSSTWSGAQYAKENRSPHTPKPIKIQGSHLRYKGEEIHDQSGIYEGLAHIHIYEVI